MLFQKQQLIRNLILLFVLIIVSIVIIVSFSAICMIMSGRVRV